MDKASAGGKNPLEIPLLAHYAWVSDMSQELCAVSENPYDGPSAVVSWALFSAALLRAEQTGNWGKATRSLLQATRLFRSRGSTWIQDCLIQPVALGHMSSLFVLNKP